MVSKSKNVVRKNVVANTVLQGVLTVLDKGGTWIGTMTDLNVELVKRLGKKIDLPQSPSALRIALNRVVSKLRRRGVSIKFGRTTDHTRTRYVRFITR
jgi:hypothetical protein